MILINKRVELSEIDIPENGYCTSVEIYRGLTKTKSMNALKFNLIFLAIECKINCRT